ncbi:MAG: NYN domain-containing protein [Candidatus Dojkabacteria bacterium]|jgi:uncharacterized LabA/DUF88 family protein
MFQPKTERLKELYANKSSQVKFLDKKVFKGKTNVYIDWANVIHWQERLDWHIDVKRLNQFLSSFDQINSVKIYQGYFEEDKTAKQELKDWESWGLEVRKKPVKEINIDINLTPYKLEDTTIINRIMLKPLVKQLPVKSIEVINNEIKKLNDVGTKTLTIHKCNFDVEMASDIRIDSRDDSSIKTFVVWSGDSDFVDTVNALKNDKKKVVIFSTRGMISHELSHSKAYVYDIKNIKNFICWRREIGA